MRSHRKLIAALLAALFYYSGGGTTSAHAVFLSTLLGGGTITSGGLTFSNFTYTPAAGPPAPTAVTVTPFTDTAGNVGIEIGGAFVQAGVGSNDVKVGYTVTGASLTDIHMAGNPVLGTNSTGSVQITEAVSGPGGSIGSIVLTNTTSPPTVSRTFGAVPSLTVANDVLLTVTGGTAQTPSASVSIIDQTFSIVPEPASMVLLGLGGLAMAGQVLSRRKAPAA